jgi:hypothetical protein
MLDQGNVHPAAWNMGKILSRDKLKVKINSLIGLTRGKLIRDSSLYASGCSVCCLLIRYDKTYPASKEFAIAAR